MNEIIKELHKAKLFGWKVNEVQLLRQNLYATKNLDVESVLSSSRKEVHITVYKKYGKELGEATFVLDEGNFNEQLKDAIFTTQFAKKKSYSLPGKTVLKKSFADPLIKQALVHRKGLNILLEKLKIVLKKLKTTYNGAKIIPNNFEIHLSFIKHNLTNSNGINLVEEKTKVYVESVLTLKKGKEQEFHVAKKVPFLSQLKLPELIEDQLSKTYDSLIAKKSKSFEGKILLAENAVQDFFTPDMSTNSIVLHASARIKHMNLSKYTLGKSIGPAKGDKLTISTAPLMKNNSAASAFDDDGVLSKPTVLVKNNVLKNLFASKRYADYLKIKPTGSVGAIKVEAGKTLTNKLLSAANVRIVSFSWFSPDNFTGDFSAEIRLGYRKEGNTWIPFRGGMFTGNIFKVVENFLLSKEVTNLEGYIGPSALLVNEGVIAGI